MSYAIAFLAGVISAFAGIWLFVRWADAVETAEHRSKVEYNRRTYERVERELESEHRKAA